MNISVDSIVYTTSKLFRDLKQSGTLDSDTVTTTINLHIKTCGFTPMQVEFFLKNNKKFRFNKKNVDKYLNLLDTLMYDISTNFGYKVAKRYVRSKRILKRICMYNCIQIGIATICKYDTTNILSDEILRHIGTLFCINELDASHNKNITNYGMKYVNSLHTLYCWGNNMLTGAGLTCLSNLQFIFTCSSELVQSISSANITCYLHHNGAHKFHLINYNPKIYSIDTNHDKCVHCNSGWVYQQENLF